MKKPVFGFVKPLVDVHTMGMFTMANLLMDCGFEVHIAPQQVCEAVQDIHKLNNYSLFRKWITDNHITSLGFSYRLDPNEGCDYFMAMYEQLLANKMSADTN
ncbi:MAG: hypothetical protein NC453_26520, partial [Muribaculum sp.]|nr:hypothetical protein [Muribaculum sp.]